MPPASVVRQRARSPAGSRAKASTSTSGRRSRRSRPSTASLEVRAGTVRAQGDGRRDGRRRGAARRARGRRRTRARRRCRASGRLDAHDTTTVCTPPATSRSPRTRAAGGPCASSIGAMRSARARSRAAAPPASEARWDAVPGFWSTIGDHTLKYAAWGDGFDAVPVRAPRRRRIHGVVRPRREDRRRAHARGRRGLRTRQLADRRGSAVALASIVVIPARDEEHQIAGCVAALGAQTVPRDQFEVIVVLDACSDRTADVAARRREQVLAPALAARRARHGRGRSATGRHGCGRRAAARRTDSTTDCGVHGRRLAAGARTGSRANSRTSAPVRVRSPD